MDETVIRRILERAEYVHDAVSLLADKRDSLSFRDYQSSREERDVVEREFQTAIEACIDIGEMLLGERGRSVPETNAEVFRKLGSEDILNPETSDRMARAAGLRNVLAHQYGPDIDDEDVYNSLQNDLDAFHEYLAQVRDAVE